MINPFKRIKNNSRYTYNNATIVVEESNNKGIAFYYLNEWWKTQPMKLKLHYMGRWEFIFKVQKYKWAK